MFSFFQKKPPPDPPTPPTAKQLKFAQQIGVTVTPKMDKWAVKKAIDKKIESSPTLQRQQAHIERSKSVKKYGEELTAMEELWQQKTEDPYFMLAACEKGREVIVDVLELTDVNIEGKKTFKIVLGVVAPKVDKGDKKLGLPDSLFWEREFNLPLDK